MTTTLTILSNMIFGPKYPTISRLKSLSANSKSTLGIIKTISPLMCLEKTQKCKYVSICSCRNY